MKEVSASPLTGYSGTLSPFSVGFNLQVSVIKAAAVTSQIHVPPKSFPARGSTVEYWYAAFAALMTTHNTPMTAAPYRFSVLLMVFQMSPTVKCSMNAMVGSVRKLPVDETTSAAEYARRGPMMSTHMIGKMTPGGVHEGMTRSRNPLEPSSLAAFERSGR
eukprot:CAMPEP_0196222462 /NCGR_PEP_ID=MMETSP0912-20130531/44773_1 /TAXON_ID=49265 /ORGANISM="Thalassiosira rotula, Strain GSO102" /LENGTH=160 /DNA_ID=CAMNT_0041501249 /DNA_START=123 /DNA_END=605 /DNA_ORIENTATION=+